MRQQEELRPARPRQQRGNKTFRLLDFFIAATIALLALLLFRRFAPISFASIGAWLGILRKPHGFDVANDNHLLPNNNQQNLGQNAYGRGRDKNDLPPDDHCDHTTGVTKTNDGGAPIRENLCLRLLEAPDPARLPEAIEDARQAVEAGNHQQLQEILDQMPHEYRDDIFAGIANHLGGNANQPAPHLPRDRLIREFPNARFWLNPHRVRVIDQHNLPPEPRNNDNLRP